MVGVKPGAKSVEEGRGRAQVADHLVANHRDLLGPVGQVVEDERFVGVVTDEAHRDVFLPSEVERVGREPLGARFCGTEPTEGEARVLLGSRTARDEGL